MGLKRLAVMTSGGDSQAMNGTVRSITRQALLCNFEVVSILEGYQGLVDGDIKPMKWADVRGWLAHGGTFLGSSRCKDFRERPGRLSAAKNLVVNGISYLAVIGGDGSLTGADTFRKEWPSLLDELVSTNEISLKQRDDFQDLYIVGLVGSIDNDFAHTDSTLGFNSALTRITTATDMIDDTAASHRRAFIIVVMGRACGWLALLAGISAGADYILTPEKPPAEGWEADMCSIIAKQRELGKRKSIVVVAEGAQTASLIKISPEDVAKVLSDRLHLDTKVTTLGHLQRGGNPSAYDRQLSTLQGVEAIHTLLDAKPGDPSQFIAVVENKIVRKPLMEAVAATQAVTQAIAAKDFQEAARLRGPEFTEYFEAYETTTSISQPALCLPKERQLNIGIIHVGAPAGGTMAATRSAVAYCLSRGHKPIALYNGFPGLVRHHDDKPLGSVRPIVWSQVENCQGMGGSEFGTNRDLPSEVGMKEVADCFALYKLEALFMIGGFEAFTALSEMRKARKDHVGLGIPMVLLPATISNNVPASETSLGSDTALNALVGYCDDIRLSASSSRRRVFIIETQGGRSGYIAVVAGLCVGALAVYTPEEGITLSTLVRDIQHLRRSFAKDQGEGRAGKLILNSEKASSTYTTHLIAAMIKEEAGKRFDCKAEVAGHMQQGGRPSPLDRVRAVRLAVKCMRKLESYAGMSREEIIADDQSTSVIGIQGVSVVFTSMIKAETEDTNWKERRPLAERWLGYRKIVDDLSGRPKAEDCCSECGKKDGEF